MFKRDGKSPLIRPTVAAAMATTLVFLPVLSLNAGNFGELPSAVWWIWLLLLLTAAPVAAYLSARRCRRSGRSVRALAGVPQVVLPVALIWLHVWLGVRSGNVLAFEEEMAYSIGTLVGVLLGLILALLVTVGALLGGGDSRRA